MVGFPPKEGRDNPMQRNSVIELIIERSFALNPFVYEKMLFVHEVLKFSTYGNTIILHNPSNINVTENSYEIPKQLGL